MAWCHQTILPEPMLTQINVTIYMASLGHNELNNTMWTRSNGNDCYPNCVSHARWLLYFEAILHCVWGCNHLKSILNFSNQISVGLSMPPCGNSLYLHFRTYRFCLNKYHQWKCVLLFLLCQLHINIYILPNIQHEKGGDYFDMLMHIVVGFYILNRPNKAT